MLYVKKVQDIQIDKPKHIKRIYTENFKVEATNLAYETNNRKAAKLINKK
jgi:hypothetical protein